MQHDEANEEPMHWEQSADRSMELQMDENMEYESHGESIGWTDPNREMRVEVETPYPTAVRVQAQNMILQLCIEIKGAKC